MKNEELWMKSIAPAMDFYILLKKKSPMALFQPQFFIIHYSFFISQINDRAGQSHTRSFIFAFSVGYSAKAWITDC
jgi:hypothetical protein